jgi:hypothetical protein
MVVTEMKTRKKPLIFCDASYGNDGFVVVDTKQVATQVLPKYFPRINGWESFQKKLRRHGFIKACERCWTHPWWQQVMLHTQGGPHGISPRLTTKLFIDTVRRMIETEMKTRTNPLVSWGCDGFVVADRKQFAMLVLSKYFPSVNSWEPFRYKLRQHGFTKSRDGSWTHPLLDRSTPRDTLHQQELQEQPPSEPQTQDTSQLTPNSVNHNAETSGPDTSSHHQKKRERPSVDGLEADTRTQSQMLKRQKQVIPGWRCEPNEQNYIVTAENVVAI